MQDYGFVDVGELPHFDRRSVLLPVQAANTKTHGQAVPHGCSFVRGVRFSRFLRKMQ